MFWGLFYCRSRAVWQLTMRSSGSGSETPLGCPAVADSPPQTQKSQTPEAEWCVLHAITAYSSRKSSVASFFRTQRGKCCERSKLPEAAWRAPLAQQWIMTRFAIVIRSAIGRNVKMKLADATGCSPLVRWGRTLGSPKKQNMWGIVQRFDTSLLGAFGDEYEQTYGPADVGLWAENYQKVRRVLVPAVENAYGPAANTAVWTLGDQQGQTCDEVCQGRWGTQCIPKVQDSLDDQATIDFAMAQAGVHCLAQHAVCGWDSPLFQNPSLAATQAPCCTPNVNHWRSTCDARANPGYGRRLCACEATASTATQSISGASSGPR